MFIVVLKLPKVKWKTEEPPKRCLHGEGDTFQRRGCVNKPVKNVRVRIVKVYRIRCCYCWHTRLQVNFDAPKTGLDQALCLDRSLSPLGA